ncbi:hypothetical protein D3C84_431810 [compost metagenome]
MQLLLPGVFFHHCRLEQDHQLDLLGALPAVGKGFADPGNVPQQRHLADDLLLVGLHQAADDDDVAVVGLHHGIRFTNGALGERQHQGIRRADVDGLALLLGVDDGGVDVQQHLALLIDLRGHVQGDAGEEGGQLHVRRDDGRRVARGGGGGRGVGDEVFVRSHLDHRLLVVGGGDARAREGVHVPLGLEQADRHVEVAIGDGETGAAPQGPEDLVGGRGDGAVEQGAAPRDALVAVPAGGETAPVHPLLVALVEGDLQDPRLQHHLALEVFAGLIQKLAHRFQLLRIGTHGDQARLGTGDDGPPLAGTDQGLQGIPQIGPVVVVAVRLDPGAVAVVAVAVVPVGRAEVVVAAVIVAAAVDVVVAVIVVVVGGHPAGTDRSPGEAATGHHQIVDRDGLGAQTRRIDMKHVALALHVEAVHVADRGQRLLQGHVFQFYRDGTGHPGVDGHAVAGALEQGTEELHRIDVMGRDAQPFLRNRQGLLGTIELQQFALHRGRQSGQRRGRGLLLHGLLEGVFGLHRFGVLIAGTSRHRQCEGKQTEMVFFHVIGAPDSQ